MSSLRALRRTSQLFPVHHDGQSLLVQHKTHSRPQKLAGDIMAIFWAHLIATGSNPQMCIPRWIVYAKSKFAFADICQPTMARPQCEERQPRQRDRTPQGAWEER